MNLKFSSLVALGFCFAIVTPGVRAQPMLAVAGVSAVIGDRTNADKTLPMGTTRVAVFNVGVVFTKYERVNAIKEEINQEMKQLQVEAKQLTENLSIWQATVQKSTLPMAEKDQYEEKIINARRRLEDMQRTARTKVGKSHEASLILLWKDVREAVKTYSAEHNIQLVIAYGDPKEKELVDLFPNLNRKMQALDQGSSMPFLIGPGVDISEAIVTLLNRQYHSKKNADLDEDAGR